MEWSDEDECLIGRCPEIMVGGMHGSDEAKVYAVLCEAVEEMIRLIHADHQELPESLGKASDLSGKFVLRLDPILRRRSAIKALAAGESLNAF